MHKVTGERIETTFSRLVDKAANRCPPVKHYAYDLKEFGDLRNAIVHGKTDAHVIAEPNDEAVKCIEHIASAILSPPKVIPLFKNQVFTRKISAPVAEAVKAMLDHSFSQIPIYSDQTFVALLTTNTVTRWLGACLEEDIFILSETTIESVLSHKEESCWEDNCCFLGKNQTIFEALEKFQTYQNDSKRLEAILITETGKPNESLLGIINVWDLPKIYIRL